MAPNLINRQAKFALNVVLMFTAIASFFTNTTSVRAIESPDTDIPDFSSFSKSLWNGQAKELRGVYVPGVMALPIVQQPAGNAGYVSSVNDVITQFGMAAEAGNVGLLAHNYLAGTKFFNLASGQEVSLIYGDGRVETFVITRVLKYQATNPLSVYSEFHDLDSGAHLTAQQLFDQVYRGSRHVTFQTCIAANGNSSWGRIFVIAEPKPQTHLIADSFFRVNTLVR